MSERLLLVILYSQFFAFILAILDYMYRFGVNIDKYSIYLDF